MALDLFMFADITGQSGLLLNMLDMASHNQVVFPVADKNPLTVVYGFLHGWSHAGCSSGSIWEVSLDDPSVNWRSKLGAGSCQRPQCRQPRTPHERARGAWKYRARRLVDLFSISGTILRQNCAVLNWPTNTPIGDSGHTPSLWRITVCMSPTTS